MCPSSRSDGLGNIVLVGMLHDKRIRFKLNKEGLAGPPIWKSRQMCSLNIESKSCGRGARQVHLNGGAASGEFVVGGWDVPV